MNGRAAFVSFVTVLSLLTVGCGSTTHGAGGSFTSATSDMSGGPVETSETAMPTTATTASSLAPTLVSTAIIPPPDGFSYSLAKDPAVHTGPVDTARLDYLSDGEGKVLQGQFVAGQEGSYDSDGTFTDSGDYIHVWVLQFASSHAADEYRSNVLIAHAVTTTPIPGVPGGTVNDPVKPFPDGGWAHIAIVTKDVFVYWIIYVNVSSAPVDMLVRLAQQQYARL